MGVQESLVGKGEAVLLVRDADHILSALHRVGQKLDLFLGPLAFRNVKDDADQARHFAFRILKRRLVEYYLVARSIGVEHRAFVSLSPWPLQQFLVGLVINLCQVFGGKVVNRSCR